MFKGKIFFFILTSLLFFQNSSYGQFWLDVAASGSLGSGIISNLDIYNDSKIDIAPKISSNAFLKIGANINETESIVLDFGISSRNFQLNQKNLPNISGNQLLTFGYNSIRILPMYRHTKEGSYIEIGPEFGFLQTQYFRDASTPSLNDNIFFKAQMMRAAIGFGGYILGNERVTIVSGLRILYDLGDLRSKQAMDNQYPYHNYENLSNKPFQAFDFQLCLELNVSLGFLVRKSCGKRTLMFHW